MTLKITSIFLVLTIIACSGKTQNKISNGNQSTDSKLNYKNFIVTKGKIGEIKLGMKISSIQNTLSKFSMKELEAYDFGFDGGGKAMMYVYNEEPIFALVPAYETDSIIAIIGLHKNLIFDSEVHVGMTVKEILKYYPNSKVELNLMTGWEEIYDEKNDFVLVFKTDENNQIGKYEVIDESSKPINLKPTLTWITII
jgi:hypothetical protein